MSRAQRSRQASEWRGTSRERSGAAVRRPSRIHTRSAHPATRADLGLEREYPSCSLCPSSAVPARVRRARREIPRLRLGAPRDRDTLPRGQPTRGRGPRARSQGHRDPVRDIDHRRLGAIGSPSRALGGSPRPQVPDGSRTSGHLLSSRSTFTSHLTRGWSRKRAHIATQLALTGSCILPSGRRGGGGL